MNDVNYQKLKSVGKGGMGEIFLAKDIRCGRNVALKEMRDEWKDNETMQERFMREAKIAAQLSHPNIIPIYAIEKSFYTMPYIEGKTLKEILVKTRNQSKGGEPLDPIGGSVPALVRIFLSVCSAMAYSHSRGVLHRDIKPDNIMVGKFGEVIILDWGLADFIDNPEKGGFDFEGESPHLTQPGKIPGTLQYMAPERAFGKPSTEACDIYSLGVVLYQLLTLAFPFHRKSIKEYRKFYKNEEIRDPEEVAPDREISPHLTSIVYRCLERNPNHRFPSIQHLVRELENYIEGVPEWQKGSILRLDRKEDWQFQENIALTKHRALMRGVESVEWVNLMISKAQFPGNIALEGKLTLHEESGGVGFLFCVPEKGVTKAVEESYCMWCSENNVRLFRSNVEVFESDQVSLKKNEEHHIRITHVNNHVRLFINGVLQFGFSSVIPLPGTRVGLLMRDGRFALEALKVSVGSRNIMVNCLAIPDAFLARKKYDEALEEYQKISHSFPGRAEGREATYRAGLTLLKEGEAQKQKKKREEFFSKALLEFEKLHNTPGGPLEYLGKSRVYKTLGEYDEEAKCLELALRKYPKHPLKPILAENILFRLHESSQTDRRVAYLFAIIVLRHLPHLSEAKEIQTVLEKHLEPLSFFNEGGNRQDHLIIQLAFWLQMPSVLHELVEKNTLGELDELNAKVALLLLGEGDETILDQDAPQLSYARFEYALINDEPLPITPYPLWSALKNKDLAAAKKCLPKNPKEGSLEFFLMGCFIAAEKGEEAAAEFLSNISESPAPQTGLLLSHFLKGRINLKNGWIDRAFYFEKLRLTAELELFSLCIGDEKLQKKLKSHFKKLQD